MTSLARQTKTALARESLQAVIRLRTAGEPPTVQTAPVLMALWQVARDAVVRAGQSRCPLVVQHLGLKALLDVTWCEAGHFRRFELRDCRTGALLLAGDTAGPAFTTRGAAAPAQHQQPKNLTVDAGNTADMKEFK